MTFLTLRMLFLLLPHCFGLCLWYIRVPTPMMIHLCINMSNRATRLIFLPKPREPPHAAMPNTTPNHDTWRGTDH
ncbi:hypothetical protein EMO92_06365 [Bifidobacterium reuteri]|uniref:Uncharacterized protein n=1 Tax=Bifidobacterium reuteri TaxID=983706 RepID=A0A5J5E8Q1_9BIFI|nr:hypothetical protein EMO92_06365 [Bifidobacterium reuteri]